MYKDVYLFKHISSIVYMCEFKEYTRRLLLMLESHERILRRIIRRFVNFPTRTYSNRISSDANVHITYEERSGRVLNLNKTCA